MDNRTLNIHYTLFDDEKELTDQDRRLLDKARRASEHAYVPYSEFRVGSAVLLDNNVMLAGNNQENASFPLGLCAERVTLFSAMSQYPEAKVTAMAVYGNPKHFKMKQYLSPCGGCRQVMSEYERRGKQKIHLLLAGNAGKIMMIEGVDNLLPFEFSSENMHG
ncbi:MAG: cytidine deaminase [Bacteroidales bacterium]|jgi:cytidine deaminase|nr:cytidine deaminase [Bacteroidales bacterium]